MEQDNNMPEPKELVSYNRYIKQIGELQTELNILIQNKEWDRANVKLSEVGVVLSVLHYLKKKCTFKGYIK